MTAIASGRPTQRRAPEWNVFVGPIAIVLMFEVLGRILLGQSFLFNTQRLQIIILQVSIVGIVAISVTQVIIAGGIDLSSGSLVGASAMVGMSFAQAAIVNGGPNPAPVFDQPWLHDLPAIVPVLVALAIGLAGGLLNGYIIARTRIPPFIATLALMVGARGIAKWWTKGQPVSFPTEGYAAIGSGINPVLIFLAMAVTGGVSLSGGRGSILGTVLGALIFGTIISGFTFLRIDAYDQEMIKAVIILTAVIADVSRQQRRSKG